MLPQILAKYAALRDVIHDTTAHVLCICICLISKLLTKAIPSFLLWL